MKQESPLFYEEVIDDTEEYRDKIATVDAEGKRVWLYPKKPRGWFYSARTLISFVFLVVFLVMPFIKVNGEQFLLFNVLKRKFVLFGILFTPQDFHLFVLAMLTFIVFIILFTVVYGRLFCGWVCPQTVFMEMFFRKIEYWIDGDANAQRKLDQAPWNADKIRKRALKYGIFYVISVIVANYFLAYIIGMDEVLGIISEPVTQNLGGFIAMLVFSFVFFFVFVWLREQVCTTICPYGRLQGVLLVKDSIVVAYDFVRGEPRGKLQKQKAASANGTGFAAATVENPVESIRKAAKPQGDCIDCKLCIAVCPTGIDIRDGTQLECTNCTACIDACDAVMDKISKPRGLIRYDSMSGIESGNRRLFTPRVLAYTAILVGLLSLDVFLLANRGVVESIILRSPGQLYQKRDDNHISNLYTYQIINKSTQELPIELRTTTPGAQLEVVGQAIAPIAKGAKAQGAFFLILPSEKVDGRKTSVVIEVYSNGKKIDEVKTNFMGPK
ncbi:MAG: cytochrome c oxidase accessory protein CcoG [Saprospiraceae bacterium]|nr:cytochrome c oxidase accessory protein CcoG [Saprospiraceae bacterium]